MRPGYSSSGYIFGISQSLAWRSAWISYFCSNRILPFFGFFMVIFRWRQKNTHIHFVKIYMYNLDQDHCHQSKYRLCSRLLLGIAAHGYWPFKPLYVSFPSTHSHPVSRYATMYTYDLVSYLCIIPDTVIVIFDNKFQQAIGFLYTCIWLVFQLQEKEPK